MHFPAYNALALAALPYLVSATSTFTLEPVDENLVSSSGCAIGYSIDTCESCSGSYPLVSAYTCSDINSRVAAGTLGGEIVGAICSGTITVNFLGDGTATVVTSVGADGCGVGCDITVDSDDPSCTST
ncbi:hypothetical protein BP6252_13317 [Coleophoma cylindrospora]|uniref:Uncharacterized protein n=1 Tax=Coleophoma cylindrospora TaxID=1849047 RepID=A0A3D8QAN3_9HELO|nr:hypothetical protein BP6252_13317 [Coleophoma cylindrospora]